MTVASVVSAPGDQQHGRREDPYRTFLTFGVHEDSLARVLDQAGAWLRGKGWDAGLGADGFQQDEGRELFTLHHHASGSHEFRMRLVESNSDTGTWRTELTVHVPRRGDGWFVVDVSSDRGRFVAVPKLARYLIQTLDARDGADFPLSDAPSIVRADGVEEFAAVVSDQGRNGLIFAAGTDDRMPFDPFVDQVRRWTREVRGQAEVFVLDPAATREFAEVVGPRYGTYPWTLRTYRPGVDPAVEEEARSHRYLTTERLARSGDGQIARLLGRIARDHAASRELPTSATKVARTLARVENTLVFQAVSQPAEAAPAPDVEAVEPIASNDETPRTREDSVLQVALARLQVQLASKQEQIELLQDTNQALTRQLEEAQLESAVSEEEGSNLADEVRWLRSRLRKEQDHEGAYCLLPDDQVTAFPPSYSDLLGRLPEIEPLGVIFTGDDDDCQELDAVDQLGKTTRTAWEALLVLADYVRARTSGDWSQGVTGYIEHTPDGYRTLPKRKHGAGETGATMNRYAHERRFPVPAGVDPSGRAVMTAHFKLGQIGMASPRMYYLDDWTRSGKVYVGYIGRHLTNTHTN